ncbi:MAG: hypothetical protein WD648_04210 [Planctomycetaceae bacterium]
MERVSGARVESGHQQNTAQAQTPHWNHDDRGGNQNEGGIMLTALKWLFGKPDKKWRFATGLFFVSWSWMTLIPVGMILSIVRSRDGIDYGLSGEIW